MKKLILLIIISVIIICSCNKNNNSEKNDKNNSVSNSSETVDDGYSNNLDDVEASSINRYSKDEKEFIYEITGRKHVTYYYDYYKIYLETKNIICKINSVNKEYSANSLDKAFWGVSREDNYDVIFINIKDRKFKTIVSDKYANLKLLPVIWNKTRQNSSKNDIISTSWSKCFILQIINGVKISDNIYKLYYLKDNGNDIITKEYEYKNKFNPEYIDIIITPNYFIVSHLDIEGEEYILINQKTGEYKVIDSQEEEGH